MNECVHDEVEEVRGDGTALSDTLVLVVSVRVAVGVEDFEKRSCVYGFDLVYDLAGKSHSFEDSEESLVVKAVEGFFPVEEGDDAGYLAFLGYLRKSSQGEEGLGGTSFWAEAVLLIV